MHAADHPPIPMRALLAGARRKQTALLDLIRKLVRAESPSDDKAAVDACVALAAAHAKALGGRVKLHRSVAADGFGDLLEARFGPKPARSGKNAEEDRSAQRCILLLGHLDTVWPVGTLRTMPCRLAEGRLWGPGALDMKAGVAMAFTAIEMLAEAGLMSWEIVLLLTSDEEVGSPVSRPIIERLAARCAAVYVLEPAQGLACKTARKGVGGYRIDVTGVASHSGVDFASGHSAILELARLLQTVASFTKPSVGRTVNPGVISGGTRSNVIAQHAFAEVDVRISRASDAARVDRLFRSLRCSDPGCKLDITGGINRPPMERKPGTVALYKQARRLAAELGFQLDEAASGGASDGNFTAALGVPTLDGLGAVGEGAHAAHESILIDHLVPRTALLAALLATI